MEVLWSAPSLARDWDGSPRMSRGLTISSDPRATRYSESYGATSRRKTHHSGHLVMLLQRASRRRVWPRGIRCRVLAGPCLIGWLSETGTTIGTFHPFAGSLGSSKVSKSLHTVPQPTKLSDCHSRSTVSRVSRLLKRSTFGARQNVGYRDMRHLLGLAHLYASPCSAFTHGSANRVCADC
jgi:hypothetical protein